MEDTPLFHIVLMQPEIPQNTGNILRTCAATHCDLHLVKPLGFELNDAKLKRAGLDYWHLARMQVYDDLEQLLARYKERPMFFLSTKGRQTYDQARFLKGSLLFFGRETAGLDGELLERYATCVYRVPMVQQARSLNLSNSVAVVLYEALRQNGFEGLV